MTRPVTACENCRYFSGKFAPNAAIETPEGFGECRRNSPVGPWSYGSVQVGDGVSRHVTTVQSAFALTSKDDWCGDFLSFSGDGFDNPDRPDTF
jgi:hypothetical protein